MKILAIDTATPFCSVGIIDEKSVISEYTVNHQDTHSKFLMGMIHESLNISHLRVNDLDGFAVTIGPGSFTGLRIGLSTVKGLALATGKPVVGVSSLEALAYQLSGCDKLICPMLDARRNEVYTARYRLKGQKIETELPPLVASPEKAVEHINEPCLMVGDGAMLYQDVIKTNLGTTAVFANSGWHVIHASTVGFMAMQRFKSYHTDDARRIEPFYIRKSDAQKMQK